MKRASMGAAAAALLIAIQIARAPGAVVRSQSGDCGLARMTLTDPTAADIDTSQIIGVHVSALASFPLPDGLPDNARFDPYETTVYRTSGQLISAQLQSDQEIDLVIADPDTDLSITAVFPDAQRCAQVADPTALQLMQMARQQVITTLGTPSAGGSIPLTGQVVVTGVGFIDPQVAALGHSGIELAPVLDVQFDQTAAATGRAAATPPVSPTPAPTATPSPSTGGAFIYYVDTAPLSGAIYCDTDPALAQVSARTRRAFRSLDLALAAYPGYRLNRPC